MAVTKRRNSGPEFAEILPEFLLKICKIFRHGIFNQKLTNESGREFYSLYDLTRQFIKLEFSWNQDIEFWKHRRNFRKFLPGIPSFGTAKNIEFSKIDKIIDCSPNYWMIFLNSIFLIGVCFFLSRFFGIIRAWRFVMLNLFQHL